MIDREERMKAMKRKRTMRKTVAIFVAIMIMLVSAMTASAGTVNVKVNVNQDAVTNLAASSGVPENQLQLIPPAAALINALDVNVTVLDDGGQADLDLGGRDALSAGIQADDQGITVMSTLFPNYAITVSQDMLAQMMQPLAGGMSGSGEGGMNPADMGAVSEVFTGYFTRFFEACSQSVALGEPVTGEYEIDGYGFDTVIPETVDMQAVAQAAGTLMDEMLADETVLSVLRSGMQYTGTEFSEEKFRAGFEGWMAHFPDEASAEYYTNSEGGETYYITGQSSYEGKDTPSYEYTMLYDEGAVVMTFHGYEEPAMEMMLAYSGNTMNASCSIGEMYTAFNFQHEENRNICELFVMDKENPFLTVTVTIDEAGERTLAMDTEGKTVLSAEELMSGSDAAGGLVNDIMTNGLGSLISSVMEEVPEAGVLSGIFAESNTGANESQKEEDGQSASKTRILQLGTSVYTIEIPDSYSEGERTEDEIRDGMVAYLNSPDMALDFDIYQFGKEGYPEDLAEYAIQEASEYESACDIVTDGDINGIDCTSYRARENYDGQEYDTITYILDGGDEYVEIVFWLDGEDAEAQVNEIISSLTFVTR